MNRRPVNWVFNSSTSYIRSYFNDTQNLNSCEKKNWYWWTVCIDIRCRVVSYRVVLRPQTTCYAYDNCTLSVYSIDNKLNFRFYFAVCLSSNMICPWFLRLHQHTNAWAIFNLTLPLWKNYSHLNRNSLHTQICIHTYV